MADALVDKELQAINHCVFALLQLLEDNDADAFDSFARVFSYLRGRFIDDMERRQKDKEKSIQEVKATFGEFLEITSMLRSFTAEEVKAFILHFRKENILLESVDEANTPSLILCERCQEKRAPMRFDEGSTICRDCQRR